MMYFAVFIGGAIGSLVRELLPVLLPLSGPVTTSFTINVVACFIVGWLFAVRHRVHVHTMHLAAVGFCGGLSTFSTFVADLIALADDGGIVISATAASLEIVVGLAAALAGEALGRRYHGSPAA